MQKEPTPTPSVNRRYLVFAAIAVAIIAVDQITKAWIRANLGVGEVGWDIGFFEIRHVQNTGAAFGIFKGIPYVFLALQAVAVVVIIGVLIYGRTRWAFMHRWPVITGLALLLGGTAGNLIDRIVFNGVVTDFLNFKVWPVFNVADSSSVIGSITLAIAIIFLLRPELKEHE